MMLDTVNFSLTQAEVEGVDFLAEVTPYLDRVAEHNYDGNIVITGSLENYTVSITPFQVKVKDGSLCKWYMGDNFKSMGRRDIQHAIEKLSDELHLPMQQASVKRLDVAENIITRHPVSVYLSHLGVLSYANRLEEPNSLYYIKRDSTLCFYDKIREQRDKKMPIPELFSKSNVLRYEQRYTKRLGATFKVKRVTGAMLYDEVFYINLLKRWSNSYRAISKVNDVSLNFNAIKTKQQFYRMALLALIGNVGGEVEMMNQIAKAQRCGNLTTKQAYDLRLAVKDACKIREGFTVKSDIITELDKKIAGAVRYYR